MYVWVSRELLKNNIRLQKKKDNVSYSPLRSHVVIPRTTV